MEEPLPSAPRLLPARDSAMAALPAVPGGVLKTLLSGDLEPSLLLVDAPASTSPGEIGGGDFSPTSRGRPLLPLLLPLPRGTSPASDPSAALKPSPSSSSSKSKKECLRTYAGPVAAVTTPPVADAPPAEEGKDACNMWGRKKLLRRRPVADCVKRRAQRKGRGSGTESVMA